MKLNSIHSCPKCWDSPCTCGSEKELYKFGDSTLEFVAPGISITITYDSNHDISNLKTAIKNYISKSEVKDGN